MIDTLGGAMFLYASKRPDFDCWEADIKAYGQLAHEDTQARRPKTLA